MNLGTAFWNLILCLVPAAIFLAVLYLRNKRLRGGDEEKKKFAENRRAELLPDERARADERRFHLRLRILLWLEIAAGVLVFLFSFNSLVNLVRGPQELSVKQLASLANPPGRDNSYFRIDGAELTYTGVAVEEFGWSPEDSQPHSAGYHYFFLIRQAGSFLVVQTRSPSALSLSVTGWLNDISDEDRRALGQVLSGGQNVLPYKLEDGSEGFRLISTFLAWGVVFLAIGLTVYFNAHPRQTYFDFFGIK